MDDSTNNAADDYNQPYSETTVQALASAQIDKSEVQVGEPLPVKDVRSLFEPEFAREKAAQPENNGDKKNAEDNVENNIEKENAVDNWDNNGQENAENNLEDGGRIVEKSIEGNVEDNDSIDIPPQDARLKFRPDEINHERTYSAFAYAAFNGQTYGLPGDVNLSFGTAQLSPSTRLYIFAREPSFKAELVLRGTIKRSLNPLHNPQCRANYVFEITISARCIDNWKLRKPSTFPLPASFQSAQFNSADPNMRKCHISFQATNIRVMNASVPKLLDANAELKLQQFMASLLAYKMGMQHKPIEVDMIVEHNTWDETSTEDIILERFTNRVINDDHTTNPSYVWSKESPREHLLMHGNIFPPALRPALTVPNLILDVRSTYDELYDIKVPAIYSLSDEHNYAVAVNDQIACSSATVTFQPVPGSSIKTNPNDNDLPKMYLCSVRWNNKDLDRPRPGDRFVFQMPFEVPDCPAPPPDKIKPPREFTGDDNDEHFEEEKGGGTYTVFHQTDRKKFDRQEEVYAQHLECMRRKWFAKIIEPSELNAPGEHMMKLFRPMDAAWNGTEAGPHVATAIPALETRISLSTKLQKWLASEAERHPVSITPVFSSQTYKDLVRSVNMFFDAFEPDKQSTVLRHHLVPLMTTGDATLDFPSEDFFGYCQANPALWNRFTIGMTPYQCAKWQKLRHFVHGLQVVKGGPAAGKSTVLIALTLLCATGTNKNKQVVIATDTNDLASDLTFRILQMIQVMSIKNLRVIRVLPTAAEDTKLRNKYIPFSDQPFFLEPNISTWAVEMLMANEGRKAQQAKQRGDKRFREDIKAVSLNAAMSEEINKNIEQWAALRSDLNAVHTSPHDPDTVQRWKRISQDLDRVRAKVLSEAHIVVATCDLLLRKKINQHLAPTLLLKDEDGASIRQKLMALLGSFPTLRFVSLFGDTKQKGPFTLTSQGNVPATFAKFPTYTSMQFFEDAGITPVTLLEQHRMYNPNVVQWISEHYYNSALIDANAKKPVPPEVTFCRKFIQEHFQIDNNYAFVVLANTKAIKAEGTPSTSNPAMQDFFMGKLIALKTMLDNTPAAQLGFDPHGFQVSIISSYLGVVNWFQSEMPRQLQNDRRFSAQVLQTVQGSQKSLVFRLNPNKRLTAFAGAGPDNLVADTRWRYGYVVGVTDDSMDSTTYGKPADDKFYMLKSSITQHIYSQYLFAQNNESLKKITLSDSAIAICEVCEQTGHTADDPKCPGHGFSFACFNCGKFGHMYAKCPDPKISQPPKGQGVCKRCGGDHHISQCELPWCKACHSTQHASSACPNTRCRRCGQLGHKGNSPLCPQAPRCARCQSTSHSTKVCKVQVTLRTMFAQAQHDDAMATHLFELETQAHAQAFPSEHVDDDLHERTQAADTTQRRGR